MLGAIGTTPRSVRFTEMDATMLRGLARRGTPLYWQNLDYAGRQRVQRLIDLRLVIVEDEEIIIVTPAEPSGTGLRLV